MNKEVKELIEQLEEYASGGGSGLYPFEESVKALLDYINQLETNRDELKKWLENHWEQSQDIWFVKILNKMQELERGKE